MGRGKDGLEYEICPYDIGRWMVKKDEGCAYLVDLVSEECSCDDFHFRKKPCKHIRLVREHEKKSHS